MNITCDWHIHSRNSCDGACIPVGELIGRAAAKGIRDFGLTDHLHSLINLPDIVRSRAEWDASNPPLRFHFGIEVSVMSQWELDRINAGGYERCTYGIRDGGPAGGALAIALTPEHIQQFGIEYVVGGTHWPMYVPRDREAIIRDYHRQNMFLAAHPLLDIVAHPWWWMGHWQDADGRYTTDPWLDDFGKIPQSMHEEFAAAAVQHGTAVEINLGAVLLSPWYPDTFAGQYVEYVGLLRSRGVKLSIGSDCHDGSYACDFARAAELISPLGIRDEELFRLSSR